MVAILAGALLIQLLVLSRLQHRSAQELSYDLFRSQLAIGSAPYGPRDINDDVLKPGAPVALLEIPTLGVREVVGEGTTAAVLFDGPGHRRDTPLPGQFGTSIVFGRRSSFGGPFGDIHKLQPDDLILVTTIQGEFEYRVLGVRREGDPLPAPLATDASRLVLATADGNPFLPDGVLRVDADLDGVAVGGPARLLSSSQLEERETAMAGDSSTLWVLVLWLQGLILLVAAATWAWIRWGRAQTWIVVAPPAVFVALGAAGQVASLLPNLS
jgi:sortase A